MLKALAKEPGERYATAGQLAEDLQRFVAGKPILARRSSTFERSWRWSKRNPLVSGLTAAVAALARTGGRFSVERLALPGAGSGPGQPDSCRKRRAVCRGAEREINIRLNCAEPWPGDRARRLVSGPRPLPRSLRPSSSPPLPRAAPGAAQHGDRSPGFARYRGREGMGRPPPWHVGG